jgi:hypothetical protein
MALQIAWRRKQSGSKRARRGKRRIEQFAFFLFLPFCFPNSISPGEGSRKIDWRDLLIYLVVSPQRLFVHISDLMFCHSAPGIHYQVFQPDFQ